MSDRKPTVALGMIVKDEVKEIEQILIKYGKFFDEIQITVTSKEKAQELHDIIHKYGGEYSFFPWVMDFSKARNFNKEQCKSDYIFRIDSDDEIINPENIRGIVEKAAIHDVSIVYCNYVYSKDDNGATNACHYRETLYKNDDNLFWNKSIHENILPKSHYNYRTVMDESIVIKHNISHDHAEKSMERNFKYLIEEYNRDREKTDPRTISYLGRMFMGVGDFEKAKFFLEKHINGSGWDEDRYLSWCCLSEIYRQEKDYKEAIACANEALQERPDYPDAYLKLHDVYFDQLKWDKAIEWGKIGLAKPMPRTFILLDPSSYSWRPTLSMSYCYFMKSEFETALKLFNIARKEAPNVDFIKQNAKLYEDAVYHKRFTEHFLWIMNYIKEKEPAKLDDLFKVIPNEIRENETLKQLRVMTATPKTWSDKSIVIYCGNTFENWSPKIAESGIGGSEEAVIYMAKEWVKMGYEVTVFNCCGENEGIFEGVTYRSYFEFNPKDIYNVLIAWRCNIFQGITAKKKIVWFHDVPHPESFCTQEEIDSFDHLVVLSKFHRTLFPKVPENKIVYSTNGIVPEHFETEEIKREPHRLMYSSSYNRGLEEFLNVWECVRREVPDAELHIYYGWDSYISYAKHGLVSMDFKAKMDKLMEQPGIVHHGRIGHKELIKEYKKAGIFAYPCTYDEINCIALTKAIASGCQIVTSEQAAVGERNTVGLAVPLKDFKKTIIRVLKGDLVANKEFSTQEYILQNSWKTVARQWRDALFEKAEVPLCA